MSKVEELTGWQTHQVKYTNNWQNIHPSFTFELIKKWQSLNFTYRQIQEWAVSLGTSFNPQDYKFINWLTYTKELSSEEILNHHQLENLKAEFQASEQSQTHAQIIHNPNN